MTVGTITLITILFFGGVSEYFLVDKLEKGVKIYVEDKERQKEILADLKVSKAFIKEFNKKRKSQLKSFKQLNADRITTKEQLTDFFNQLIKERLAFQERIISDRINVANKINQDEWDKIIENSQESFQKTKEKQQKKADKGKVSAPFEKTGEAIEKHIIDEEKKAAVRKALDTFIRSQEETVDKLRKMNAEDSDVINKNNASNAELMKLAEDMNKLRQHTFESVIEFHLSVKENTTVEEWAPIMKAFNKEVSITAH